VKQFSQTAKDLKPGIYEHYEGRRYRVYGVAWHSETLEEVVVYQLIDDKSHYWVRPLDIFLEEVEIDGRKVPRFVRVDEKD